MFERKQKQSALRGRSKHLTGVVVTNLGEVANPLVSSHRGGVSTSLAIARSKKELLHSSARIHACDKMLCHMRFSSDAFCTLMHSTYYDITHILYYMYVNIHIYT